MAYVEGQDQRLWIINWVFPWFQVEAMDKRILVFVIPNPGPSSLYLEISMLTQLEENVGKNIHSSASYLYNLT